MSLQEKPKAVGNIDRLLRPKSIAIVGASPTPGALGNTVLKYLEKHNFSGELHLINPKRDDIDGRPCIKSPLELPMGIDAAILAIPRVAVLDTIKALASRGCGAVVVFSAGFAEAGEEGLAEQREIGEIARAAGMIIEGPNCLGCVNYVDGIPLTFVEGPMPRLKDKNGVAIISQSGAMAAVLASNLFPRKVGVSYFISTGNEAGSGVEDYVEYMLNDPHSAVIAMVVEQFRNPARFLALAEKAREIGKPIVLLHPGRSQAAAESAATHTGAMAGDYKVMKAKVERAGVILVSNLEELGDVVEIASRAPSLPSGGTAVLAESGAFKALTLDLCEDINLHLPILNDSNAPNLRAAMPEFVAVSNPVDMTAQSLVDPDMYQRIMSALIPDDRFGTIVLAIIQTDDTTTDKKFPYIIEALKQLNSDKPIIFAGVDEGGIVKQAYIDGLREIGTPYFPSPERALRAIGLLTASTSRSVAKAKIEPMLVTGLPKAGVVAEYQAKAILRPLDIPFPASTLATSKEEAIQAADALNYPVVMKAQSAALSHKSDAGGVIVNIRNAEGMIAAWDKMTASVETYKPGLKLDGMLIEAMGKQGVELIIGAQNDPDWGAVVLVGFGGVQAEIYQDVRLLTPDLDKQEIIQALLQLKGAKLLTGFRGSAPVDLDAVADVIITISRLMINAPSIAEIDLNPVIALPKGEGVLALDALMLMK
jgi:acyl-CoA synthetase (NDP forming)